MRADLRKLPKGQSVGLCQLLTSDIDPYNYFLEGVHIMFEPENSVLLLKGNYVWALYLEAALKELLSASDAPELVRVFLFDTYIDEPNLIVERILEAPESNFNIRVEFDSEADAEFMEGLETGALLLLEDPNSV